MDGAYAVGEGIGRRQLAVILAASYAARVPVTAIPLGLILVMRDRGHAYDLAGLATGLYTLALSLTAPVIGRLADRYGAPRVFAVGAPVGACALLAIGAGTGGGSASATIALAVVVGAAMPPLGALTRGLLTPLLDGDRRARVFAIDATAQELCFIAGPLVLAGLVAVMSPPQAMVAIAALLVCGSVGYLLASRGITIAPTRHDEERGSPLRSRGLRAVLLVATLAGAMFGAVEISITAALDAVGRRDQAGLLLGVWSIGSLVGGALIVRFPVRRPLQRLAASLVLCAGFGALAAATTDTIPAFATVLVIHGIAGAPLMATCYVLVPLVVGGRISEAFAWLTSAVVGGIAAGTTVGGLAVDASGAAAGLLVSVAAVLIALAVSLAPLRRVIGTRDPSVR
jgi:MFS family permease